MIRYLVAAALVLGGYSPAAQALTCSVDPATVDFGLVNVMTGAPVQTQTSFQVTCSRDRGEGGGQIAVCLALGSGSGGAGAGFNPRYLVQGSRRISYQLYTDSTLSSVWGGTPSTGIFVNLSAGNGQTRSETVTVYGQIPGNQAAALGGFYSSSFQGAFSQLRYGNGSTTASCTTLGGSLPITVQAQVDKNCMITASDLDFGISSAESFSSGLNGQSSLQVSCGSGVAYSVGLSAGQGPAASSSARAMTSATTPSAVAYSLYRDASRAQVWGDIPSGMVRTGVGNGTWQTLPVYGRILPQTSPDAGEYEDTVVATIEF